jgi:hypothetical protein
VLFISSSLCDFKIIRSSCKPPSNIDGTDAPLIWISPSIHKSLGLPNPYIIWIAACIELTTGWYTRPVVCIKSLTC